MLEPKREVPMGLGVLRSNLWRKSMPIRVVLYLIIIGLLIYARMNPAPPQPSSANPLPTVETKTTPTPEEQAAKEEEERNENLAGLYPDVTVYSWTARANEDGSQDVWVLARTVQRVESVEWNEFRLRAKGSNADVATAAGPEGQAKPKAGAYAKLVFKLPAGTPAFAEGRIFLWTQDLPGGALTAANRIAADQIDQALEDLRKEAPPPAPAPQKSAAEPTASK
ncbi:MAG: hypothetical protein KIS92_06665 [Planctomycetota bacterium]|nr:hypothetical protein [Planctomycetota bacterium]